MSYKKGDIVVVKFPFILKPKLSDFEAEPHFLMQNILLKQQF